MGHSAKAGIIIVSLLLLSISVFRFIIPTWVAFDKNQVVSRPPYKVTDSIQQLHQRLTIADLHADSLLWGRDLLKESTIGHIDIPRLLKANVALQVFSVVTKTPKNLNLLSNADDSDNITLLALAQGWPMKSISSLTERALYQASLLQQFANKSNKQFVLIRSSDDLHKILAKRKNNERVVAGILSLEGAHALEEDIDNLRILHDAGYRIIGLTHFFDNDTGGSAHGLSKDGLTTFGRTVVEEAQSKHMLIDLAHASNQMMDEVLSMSTQPVIVSHTGVKGTCNRSRNLTDKQMRAIAATGGLIGIGFWKTAVCGQDVDDIVRAMMHTKNTIGVEHIALGSDFDGAVSTPFDVTGLPLLTETLYKHGFNENEIRLIMGGNIMRLLDKTL